jgi:hypothetical protein
MAELDYELFALRYATRHARRGDHFIGGDPHDGPMPMDYFVWVARGGGRTFVIDTGFNAEVSEKRKRTFLRSPVEALPRSASIQMRLKMSSSPICTTTSAGSCG